jgi:putative inorganic carbon (HCO3(-)) transporter
MLLPLFPSFITLTGATIPGVSVVPRALAIALVGFLVAIACVTLPVIARSPGPQPMIRPLLLWAGAAILAAVAGFAPAAGLLFIALFALGILWHASVMRFYPLPGAARTMYAAFFLSGTLASIAAIVMVMLRQPADQYVIGHGRAIGTFVLPGELAGYLVIFLPIAFALARVSSDRRLRMLAWSAVAVGMAALLLTFSRAGWVGAAAAAAFYALFAAGARRRLAAAILIGGFGAVMLVFNVHHNPSENFTRIPIWQAAIAIARRFPLTGVGPFDFARVYPLVRVPGGDPQAFHAHSFLLTMLAETGIVGVAAALAAWWVFVLALRSRLASASPRAAAISLAVAAGLAGSWVQGLIDTVSVVIFGLWLPSMALALAAAEYGEGAMNRADE